MCLRGLKAERSLRTGSQPGSPVPPPNTKEVLGKAELKDNWVLSSPCQRCPGEPLFLSGPCLSGLALLGGKAQCSVYPFIPRALSSGLLPDGPQSKGFKNLLKKEEPAFPSHQWLHLHLPGPGPRHHVMSSILVGQVPGRLVSTY